MGRHKKVINNDKVNKVTMKIKKIFGRNSVEVSVINKDGETIYNEVKPIPMNLINDNWRFNVSETFSFWLTNIEQNLALRLNLGKHGVDYIVKY